MKWIALVAGLAGASMPTATAQGTLWVVDDDGGAGVDFADLQLALDTAEEGDGVLVRAGDYPGNFVIDGKSLTVIGEPGARVVPTPGLFFTPGYGLEIHNLAVDQQVAMLGLEFGRDSLGFVEFVGGLLLEDNEGVVWISDVVCELQFTAEIIRSDQVVVTSSTGTVPLEFAPDPGVLTRSGLCFEDASAAIYDSFLEGMWGLGECKVLGNCNVIKARAGVASEGASSIFLSGSELHGGDGLEGADENVCTGWEPGSGGAGGDALEVESPGLAAVIDTLFVPGTPGLSYNCPVPPAGVAISGGGSVTEVAGVSRSLLADSPVREGESVSITFRGAEGDFVLGLAGLKPLRLDLPGFFGPLTVNAPFVVQTVGSLPAGGELTLEFTAGDLPPGLDFFARYLQALHLTPALEVYASAPAALVVLGAR